MVWLTPAPDTVIAEDRRSFASWRNATFEQRAEMYMTHRLCAILRSLGKHDLVSMVDGLSPIAKCDSIEQYCKDNLMSVPSDMNVFFAAALMDSIAQHQSISIDVGDRSVETSLIRPLHDFQRTMEFKILEKRQWRKITS